MREIERKGGGGGKRGGESAIREKDSKYSYVSPKPGRSLALGDLAISSAMGRALYIYGMLYIYIYIYMTCYICINIHTYIYICMTC